MRFKNTGKCARLLCVERVRETQLVYVYACCRRADCTHCTQPACARAGLQGGPSSCGDACPATVSRHTPRCPCTVKCAAAGDGHSAREVVDFPALRLRQTVEWPPLLHSRSTRSMAVGHCIGGIRRKYDRFLQWDVYAQLTRGVWWSWCPVKSKKKTPRRPRHSQYVPYNSPLHTRPV